MKKSIFIILTLLSIIGYVNSQTETILKHRILKKEGRERQNYIKEKMAVQYKKI